ncbi:hypothetical protein [Streptacidiphilus rugosus]|uniref:hypothetical protein n=1 Tax=Streptacidiphilus rugosus TaxID=405783 RepID=UPI00055C8C7B|nr:hypothetical protein [Streptacidiphilus rugosus]
MRRTLILAAGALFLAGCASSSAPATPAATTPDAATPSASLDPATALHAWADDGGSAALSTIGSDLTDVSNALGQSDLTGAQAPCAKLTADVETDQAGTPVPDKAAAAEWSLMLSHLQAAAADCTTAAATGDSTKLDEASAELSIGGNHLTAFTNRFKQVTG